MANFFAELKRRHIYRVAAAYAVVAWVLLQLAANLSPILDLPPWIARTIILLLVLGFPLALIFAWVQQLGPEGGTPRASSGKLDWFLAGALVVVIALVSYQQLAPSQTTRTQAGVEDVRTASAAQTGISIAVLPFVNLSSDAEQEFFSDGITEEITSALARIADLRVVARTSAFQFKGQNRDMQAIGEALRATHLIEGSVRKAGTRVRITAQLIDTGDGTHVWTENYDRELTDIFAIQEDIATAIAGALRMPLGLAPGVSLVSNRNIDPESYQQFLHAKALSLIRGPAGRESLNILERVVVGNPDYAPAWALLSQVYGRVRNSDRGVPDPKSESAARRALELDPNLPDGYRALSGVERRRQNLLLSEELESKALALDPNHPDSLYQYAILLSGVGRQTEALAMRQQLRAQEPFVPLFNGNLADSLWLTGQNEAAIEIFKALPAEFTAGGTPRGLVEIARIYLAAGRYSEAADVMLELSSMNLPPDAAAIVKDAARLLRTAPAEVPSPQDLPRLGAAGFVYLYIGAPGRALEDYEEQGETGQFSLAYISLLWHPSYAPVRKMDRFKAYVRKAGLVEYWRAKGWPELCRPTGADDFVCE